MKYDFVNRYLSIFFRRMGYSVGKHPLLYSLTPLLVIGVLSSGFHKIKIMKDTEDLYSPVNGRATKERRAVERLFPSNMSDIDITRITRLGRLGFVIFENKNRGSMLKEIVIDEIINVDNIVQNITIAWNNKTYTYRDLCARTADGSCFYNNVLSLKGKIKKILKKLFRIRYPVDINKVTMNAIFYAYNLGKVLTDEDGYIEDVSAIRLIYLLDYKDKTKNMLSLKWEERFIETLTQIKCEYLNIYQFAASSIDVELNKVTESALPLLPITVFIMLVFSVVTCMTTNWVTSKPWIGIAGCLNPMLGVIGAFGLLLWADMEYIDINISIPFLLLV